MATPLGARAVRTAFWREESVEKWYLGTAMPRGAFSAPDSSHSVWNGERGTHGGVGTHPPSCSPHHPVIQVINRLQVFITKLDTLTSVSGGKRLSLKAKQIFFCEDCDRTAGGFSYDPLVLLSWEMIFFPFVSANGEVLSRRRNFLRQPKFREKLAVTTVWAMCSFWQIL